MTRSSGSSEASAVDVELPRALDVVPSGEDRYTVVPADADVEELQTAWLTVDADTLVDLDCWQ